MEKKHKIMIGVVVGASAIVVAYQLYKKFSKPKTDPTETKSSVTGSEIKTSNKDGMIKYHTGHGKVFKAVADGFNTRWVMIADSQQPKAMDWYNLNGKWIWTKWNGKLEDTKIPNSDKFSGSLT